MKTDLEIKVIALLKAMEKSRAELWLPDMSDSVSCYTLSPESVQYDDKKDSHVTEGFMEELDALTKAVAPKPFFEWTDKDHQEFEKSGHLDQGKWTFFKCGEQYEATMQGLYTHVFDTLDDMLHRRSEVDFYEYCSILSEERDEETFINSDGKIREY